ncbi:MAG: hypothetical protein RBS53_05120 [Bacteroidales bacterium]|jgi:hypothetical protein|nr:hypothetical protein [Bacteroidales bacterium]NLM91608.1 hypothetical protein [Bacteroidales bacterium]
MKRKIGLFVFALALLSMGMSGCRSRELCPAYTSDNLPGVEESIQETT